MEEMDVPSTKTHWWLKWGLAAIFAGLPWIHANEESALAAPTDSRAQPAKTVADGGLAMPPEHVAATEAEWLASNPTEWRIGRLVGLPSVLIIEFPGLASQGRAMNRMASLLEKAGAPRDRVLDDTELRALIERSGDTDETYYEGHDYRASGMARFFTLARRQDIRLNADEERLLLLLQQNQVLRPTESGWQGVADQALVTFTATQARGGHDRDDELIDSVRQRSVFEHELSHGRYFTDAGYREACVRVWHTAMSPRQRAHMKRFLAGLRYNALDEDLMINETQALLFHTPDGRAFDAAAVALTQAEMDDLRNRFADMSRRR